MTTTARVRSPSPLRQEVKREQIPLSESRADAFRASLAPQPRGVYGYAPRSPSPDSRGSSYDVSGRPRSKSPDERGRTRQQQTPRVAEYTVPRLASPAWRRAPSVSPVRHSVSPERTMLLSSQHLSPSIGAAKASHRRGHHHKHSLSHQFFLPPKERAPLNFREAVAIPTLGEVRASLNPGHKLQLAFGSAHLVIAWLVYQENVHSRLHTTAAYALVFDALGVLAQTVLDVMGGFDVWRTGSLALPWGLQQIEVLIDFALSVFMLYSGLVLVREPIEDAMFATSGTHTHAAMGEEQDGHAEHPLVIVIALVMTVFRALAMQTSARLQCLMGSEVRSLHVMHVMTMGPLAVLLLSASTGLPLEVPADHLLSTVAALAMCWLGASLVQRLGMMLVLAGCGHASGDVQECIAAIERDDKPCVTVARAQVWQPLLQTGMASFVVQARNIGENRELAMRERAIRRVRELLTGGYGSGSNVRWEIYLEIERVD